MSYLIKRKRCKSCGKSVVRLVNDEHCMTCYQSNYYQNITKKKRKTKTKKRKNMVWWLQAYFGN